uniref:Uncharacterized protein n=1 Tax=Magallana gigas TaxID=29159 RepID=A0A8W8KTP3_MAGGI
MRKGGVRDARFIWKGVTYALLIHVYPRPVHVIGDYPRPVQVTYNQEYARPAQVNYNQTRPLHHVPPVQYDRNVRVHRQPVQPVPSLPLDHNVREYAVPVYSNREQYPTYPAEYSSRKKKPKPRAKKKTPRDRIKTDYSNVREPGRLLSYAAHELFFEDTK